LKIALFALRQDNFLNNYRIITSNLGTFDIGSVMPVINPPEAAILGLGNIVEKVVVHDGKIAQRAVVILSLTFDHWLVDGAPAAIFLQTIRQLFEKPAQLEE
jgi:pyruvate dehydrogenase E2 component (dihydrolipoamide acetyltransferase)